MAPDGFCCLGASFLFSAFWIPGGLRLASYWCMKCERCGGTSSVTFGRDPFKFDIYGDSSKHWLCAKCREELTDSI